MIKIDKSRSNILLTGATGFLGHYVLRDLLESGAPVTVLARSRNGASAENRVWEALGSISVASMDRRQLTVLDVGNNFASSEPFERIASSERTWDVIHAAGSVQFFPQDNGDPWRTNVEGTRSLLQLLGPVTRHWIQISTAYVSPIQDGVAYEQARPPAKFRCPYEESKYAAEQLVLAAEKHHSFSASIVRPSIIVGEYVSGRTSSYDGFYGPANALARLVKGATRNAGVAKLPLRFDVSADSCRNLVPVDWVSNAIVKIAFKDEPLGGVIHLTPDQSTTNQDICQAMEKLWKVSGLTFPVAIERSEFTSAERLFYRAIHRLAPNWHDEPSYDNRRFRAEFPEHPCPRIDSDAVERLLRFADSDCWGKRKTPCPESFFECAEYLEQFLPKFAPQSVLPRLQTVTTDVAFEISGSGGGCWVCQLEGGDVVGVERSSSSALECRPSVTFATATKTFREIVAGRLSPQKAFLNRKIEIKGNIETGLKLAMIFGCFVDEFPFKSTPSTRPFSDDQIQTEPNHA